MEPEVNVMPLSVKVLPAYRVLPPSVARLSKLITTLSARAMRIDRRSRTNTRPIEPESTRAIFIADLPLFQMTGPFKFLQCALTIGRSQKCLV